MVILAFAVFILNERKNIDTDKKTIVIHDGTTSGGTPLSTEANTGAGLITVTNAYQANVGVAIASGQANTGA